jgi:Flp pilus assembly protein TadG
MKLSNSRTGSVVCSRLVSRHGGRQRGAVLIEQALIIPILVALFFGIIDMGRALYSYTYVSYIARDATRWASVRSTNLNGPPAPVDPGDVTNYVKNVSGMGLDTARITANTSFVAPPNATPLCPGGTGNSLLNRKPGCVVQVTVNYNFRFFFFPVIPVRTLPMSSESQMIITR